MSRFRRRATRTTAAVFAVALAPAILLGATGSAAQEPDPGAPPAEIDPPPGTAVFVTPADSDSFAQRFEVADELSVGSVLRIDAVGFEPGMGAVRQCVLASEPRCGNRLDIDFDDDGVASVHYALGDPEAAAEGGCGPTGDRCYVLVTDEADNYAEIDTVFGATAAPAGAVSVEPGEAIASDGSKLEVSVVDHPPGTATVLLCAAPSTGGTQRCRNLTEQGGLRVGPDGTGSTSVVVTPGPVGSERAPCDWRHRCAIVVDSAEAFTRAPARPVTFAAPAGAGYDPGRLVVGLLVVAALLVVALWLALFTDWSPIGEEAAPEIDEADYADLDAIVAALDRLEARESV
jgi:hypothetical protein